MHWQLILSQGHNLWPLNYWSWQFEFSNPPTYGDTSQIIHIKILQQTQWIWNFVTYIAIEHQYTQRLCEVASYVALPIKSIACKLQGSQMLERE